MGKVIVGGIEVMRTTLYGKGRELGRKWRQRARETDGWCAVAMAVNGKVKGK